VATWTDDPSGPSTIVDHGVIVGLAGTDGSHFTSSAAEHALNGIATLLQQQRLRLASCEAAAAR